MSSCTHKNSIPQSIRSRIEHNLSEILNPTVQFFLCTHLKTAKFSVHASRNSLTSGFRKQRFQEHCSQARFQQIRFHFKHLSTHQNQKHGSDFMKVRTLNFLLKQSTPYVV